MFGCFFKAQGLRLSGFVADRRTLNEPQVGHQGRNGAERLPLPLGKLSLCVFPGYDGLWIGLGFLSPRFKQGSYRRIERNRGFILRHLFPEFVREDIALLGRQVGNRWDALQNHGLLSISAGLQARGFN